MLNTQTFQTFTTPRSSQSVQHLSSLKQTAVMKYVPICPALSTGLYKRQSGGKGHIYPIYFFEAEGQLEVWFLCLPPRLCLVLQVSQVFAVLESCFLMSQVFLLVVERCYLLPWCFWRHADGFPLANYVSQVYESMYSARLTVASGTLPFIHISIVRGTAFLKAANGKCVIMSCTHRILSTKHHSRP